MREYIRKDLVEFAQRHPHLSVTVAKRNGRHPIVIGKYGRK